MQSTPQNGRFRRNIQGSTQQPSSRVPPELIDISNIAKQLPGNIGMGVVTEISDSCDGKDTEKGVEGIENDEGSGK